MMNANKKIGKIHWIGAPGGELHGLVAGVKIFAIDHSLVLRSNVADAQHSIPCASIEQAKACAEDIVKGLRSARNKYHAKRTEFDGIVFDSEGEARRWGELKQELRAGEIKNLRRQISYKIEVNGMLICRYRADYVYERGQKEIVEDYKGVWTPKFRLVRKLMLAVHGVHIKISGNVDGVARPRLGRKFRAGLRHRTMKRKKAA